MSDLSPMHQRAQARPVRAPHGTTLHCRNWLIEMIIEARRLSQ